MGRLWGQALQQMAPEHPFDLLVPVPLSASKYYKRGYNQSALIAQGLSSTLDIPVREDIIRRIKSTESQTFKNRQERIENIQDAFSIIQPPPNSHILLVDDVITTGATLDICANTLAAMAPGCRFSIGSLAVRV